MRRFLSCFLVWFRCSPRRCLAVRAFVWLVVWEMALASPVALGQAADANVRAPSVRDSGPTQERDSQALAAQRFALGVLTTIDPEVDRDDALSLHDVVEIRAQKDLEWTPVSLPLSRTLYAKALAAAFPQDLWCLELTFKPLRMIKVDVPQPDGSVRNELLWYLVYRVRNTGTGLAASIAEDGTFSSTPQATAAIRFIPSFVLTSHDLDRDGDRVGKSYLDRVLPSAMGPITQREFREGKLLHSVEMASHELPVEQGRSQQGLWGVAIWQGVDPEIDFFSVHVEGLTNAYRWEDPSGAFKLGDAPGAGRKIQRKGLQLNFWRPGDRYGQDEREIRFGAAPGKGSLYDGGEGVSHQWVYR